MATQAEIEAHYDTVGKLHALRLRKVQGGFPDYSCAFFDGDFTKTLKQAQEDKHAWIFDGLGLGQDLTGKRILDIGCGWGPILRAVQQRGGTSLGLTLSAGQVDYCRQHQLDVRLLDYKDLREGQLGTFDAIISVGAFEHFCSVEEYLTGKQDEVYRRFFEICAALLVPQGRLFVQTMTWGTKTPDYTKVSLNAEPHSEAAILGRLEKFYPGSWLPSGLTQIIQTAKPHFIFVQSNNGRRDYLETLTRWSNSSRNLLQPAVFLPAVMAGLALLLRGMIHRDARIQLLSIYYGDQRAAFQRKIMSHERIFFEKKS